MDERVQDRAQAVLVVSQDAHRELTCDAERALEARDAEPVDDVLRQPERHALGRAQLLTLCMCVRV